MDYRKILLIIFFLFACAKSFGAVFVVTSNADSGPGTLRDALTQAAANGSATQDIIQFNLPNAGPTDVTITLLSALPSVSSNIVIDGTTEPGNKLGRSDAKIILQPGNTGNAFNALTIIGATGVEIYGLCIQDFNSTISYGVNGDYTYVATAVYTETSSNIQIGAPGKGNVFVNNGFAVTGYGISIIDGVTPISFSCNNLKFYSNIVGFEADGKTYRGTNVWYNGGGVNLSYCEGDIRIGDDDITTRNIFGNGSAILNEATGTTLHPSTILIKNNYFSYDIDGNPSALININAGEIFAIFIAEYSPIENLDYPYTVSIINNKFEWPYSISCGHITGNFTMQGNNLLYGLPIPFSADYGGDIGASSDENILIGGENPGEANVLYGEEIDLFSRKSVLLHKNSIYCVPDFRGIYYPSVPYLTPPLPLPVISITKVTTASVSGTATPLSEVELFWDDDCSYCEPLTYITTVYADASGNWNYSGTIQKGVVASATLNGFTSVFTKSATLNGNNVTHYACGTGGSITGTSFINTGGYQWKNANNQIVGTDSVINNLPPGNYTLTALNGTCSTNYNFTIYDATPQVNDNYKQITPPSCSKNTGSITGLYLNNFNVINDADERGNYNVYTYKWIDAGGNVVGTGLDLNNVAAGSYSLQVSYQNQCTVTYGPITLQNVSGPNIDQSNASVQSTNCGQSTGSITNITATGTGTLNYVWLNSQQQQVGTGIDLMNQPAGTYQLQVTDGTQCGPVYSTNIQIPETNSITMDESAVQTTLATCGKDVGSITGIKVTGASEYYWTYGNNKIVTTTPDLLNVAAGDYMLTATNSYGCIKTSQVYHISNPPPTVYPSYNVQTASPCFGKANGSITVSVDGLATAERWVDYQGTTIDTAPQLSNIAAGAYQLYLTDKNGCETSYGIYNLSEIPQLSISAGSELVTNDQCTLLKGSITNIQVTGGVQPYTYSWQDAGNNTISSSIDLTGVGEGTYTLNVNDASGCGAITAVYTVQNQDNMIPSPSVSDVQVCSPGDALLQVNNASKIYTYRLYDTPTATTPLVEQPNGVFKVTVKENTSYYISEVTGSCESTRAEVKVSVGLSSVDIANAFTPNGDGVNDYWKIKGIENYPTALVQVFNRYGQKVFESRGYSQPFDGTFNGKALPVGVYYFIINLSINCNLLTGSLTIIR